MSKQKQYYVYVIRDPRPGKDNVPVYVGKGGGDRHDRLQTHERQSHNRRLRHFFAKCKTLGLTPSKTKVYLISETSAFQAEMQLIAQFGRCDLGTGTLYNLTNGGEGTSGWVPTEKFRKALSVAKTIEMRRPDRKAQARASAIAGLPKLHDPVNKAKAKVAAREYWGSDNSIPHRAKRSARAQKQNSDLEFLAKCEAARRKAEAENPDCYAPNRARMTALNGDPEFQAKRKDGADKRWTQEARAAFSERVSDPEYQAKCRDGQNKFWASPEAKAKRAERNRDPGFIAKCNAGRLKNKAGKQQEQEQRL